MYELNLQQFSGPIEKLLSLIEEKKLEITELSLAAITADFIDYLKKIEQSKAPETCLPAGKVRFLADFVVIAATLILIKSKSILPSLELSGEEEKNIKELEDRLKMYSVFKPALAILKKKFDQKEFSVSRDLFLNFQPVFYPAQNADKESLKEQMEKIFAEFKKISIEEQKIEISLIKIEEKIEEIIKRMEAGIENFKHIIKDKSKTEIIVLFLALLHLLKEQVIKVEQNKRFDDIIINRV
ncbi:segregation/condensation protein A [Candidatus Wolfebacteria bacterium]|nr:segregation/condensation protein A [Candidatus Wolfebacteria bacterium]